VVIVHHLGGMPSGFIGVDVFFVISGFVITHALIENQHLGLVAGLRHFYYRRIVRILPPLFIVTLASFAVGWALFFDVDFQRLQQAVASQAYFVQNFHFTRDVEDYFQAIPSTDLALHTWSLAVEEQFYLMCPVLMILLIRLRRRAPWTATLAAMAVTTGTAAAAIAPSTALDHLTNAAATAFVPGPLNADSLRFYALPFRAWELLLGCSAMLVRSQWDTSLAALAARARPIFYAVPTALLAAAFMDLERRSWPNLYTLAVCLVTACGLLLVDTRPIPLERRMSVARALAHVGSTSYSAYLWHWPLLGYLAYTNVDFGVSRLDYALYFLILTGLVAATYHTVEKRRLSISVRASVVLLIAFVVAGRYLGTSPRDKTWFREEKQQILASAAYDETLCIEDPAKTTGKFVVLFGDSHAQMVAGQFQRSAREHGYDVLCIKGSMARLGTERQTTEEDFERAVQSDGYRGTLMVMRWNAYSTGFPPYEVQEHGNRFLTLDGRRPRDGEEAFRFFIANVNHLVRSITSARPARGLGILLQVPNMPFFPEKESLVDYHGLRFRALPPKSAVQHRTEHVAVRRVFEQLRDTEPRVSVLDPTPLFCDAETCKYRHGWNVLYKDDDHLSVYGETLLAPVFNRWLERLEVAAPFPSS